MNRIDIIQSLIDRYHYKSYCEIGVASGECFNKIRCDIKIGVDPDKNSIAKYKMTSNEFFTGIHFNAQPPPYDIYFIDGLHYRNQCFLDISNALYYLSEHGTIVCHDMLPTSKFMQEIPRTTQGEWTGNVWRAWVDLRTISRSLTMRVVNCDYGCGIINKAFPKSIQPLRIDGPISYEDFELNAEKWMNIITEEEFKQIYL